jgi:hypothetical protein
MDNLVFWHITKINNVMLELLEYAIPLQMDEQTLCCFFFLTKYYSTLV